MDQSNINYLSLARKYRPQTMKDLIGQEVLSQTLENAFHLNQIAQAFILTGIRGIGKTTTARIVAKALNCIGEDGSGEMTLEPCGKCNHCQAIAADSHLDIIEIDAASNTGVDDIRNIISNAKYVPLTSRYKVFIIDEVHMLSRSAFNALLKILEEPPMHLKFIFATTEIRKIPITVLSRCQRFDLQKISTKELASYLGKIAKEEKVDFDPKAIEVLAKMGAGSVRDCLSLLDQAIIFCNKNIQYQEVLAMLGQSGEHEIYQLFDALLKGDETKVSDILNKQYQKGTTAYSLLHGLLDACHNVTCFKVMKSEQLLDILDKEKALISLLSENTELPILIKVWQILLKGIKELQGHDDKTKIGNMILVKIMLVSQIGSLEQITKQLKSENIKTQTEQQNNQNKLGSTILNLQTTPKSVDSEIKEPPEKSSSSDDILGEIQEIFPKAKLIKEEPFN